MKRPFVRQEIVISRQQIEDELGEPAVSFAYPYAFPESDRLFVNQLCKMLDETGYRAGVTTVVGRVEKSDSRMFMKRLPVNSHDDTPFFRSKLEGGYDWLRPVQYMYKLTKSSMILRRAADRGSYAG